MLVEKREWLSLHTPYPEKEVFRCGLKEETRRTPVGPSASVVLLDETAGEAVEPHDALADEDATGDLACGRESGVHGGQPRILLDLHLEPSGEGEAD